MASRIGRVSAAFAVAALGLAAGGATNSQATTASVLLVCPKGANDSANSGGPSLPCPSTAYGSIQAAVDKAQPGDWVLVAPGVYHERSAAGIGVSITTAGLHLRGMDRNAVVVDGTKPMGQPPCSATQKYQDTSGRNGIVVRKVDGTSIDNLTVCNYLKGTDGAGNQIWWNGGDGSGQIHMGPYSGSYITGTSTYFSPDHPGLYGIFVSNSRGPGLISNAYASNMADSAFYVGACPDCNATLDRVHAENSALGFSGTNAGGHLTITNSEWDSNKAGIVPNSLNNDDAPPPQSGLCPGSTTYKSCTFITHNLVHDNNNPNAPTLGISGAAPIGTGIELSGASFNTVDQNTIYNQKSWGIAVHDYPDTETPPASGVSNCQGGTKDPTGTVCTFFAVGNVISKNALHDNGGFRNPTNGDLALQDAATAPKPRNCFFGNTDGAGPPSSDPPSIQTLDGPPCTAPGTGDSTILLAELVCASGAYAPCPGVPVGQHGYPSTTGIAVLPLPRQTTMPNPCKGVPDNAWCSNGVIVPGPSVPETPLVLLIPLVGAAAITLAREVRGGRRGRPRAA